MINLSEKEKEKLIKVLNLTSSGNNNEALAALRIARVIMAKGDLDWSGLVHGFIKLNTGGYTAAELEEAYEFGLIEGHKNGKKQGYQDGYAKGTEYGFSSGYSKGRLESRADIQQQVKNEFDQDNMTRYKTRVFDETNPPIDDRKKIEELFNKLGNLDAVLYNFDSFYTSVKRFYEKRGFISTKQYNRLKDIYEENS